MKAIYAIAICAILTGSVGNRQEIAPPQVDQEKAKAFRNLPPEEQERLRNVWRKFKELPPEEQRLIAENAKRLKDLSPDAITRLKERVKDFSLKKMDMLKKMLDRSGIPPFMRPHFIGWLKHHFSKKEVDEMRLIPMPERREKFQRMISRFKTDTIQMALRKKLLPRDEAERLALLPFPERWRKVVEYLRDINARRMEMEGREPLR